MNKLYYYEATYGQIFWDENNVILTAFHENDYDFDKIKLDKLFNHFHIELIRITDLPDWLSYEELIGYGIEEE